MTAGPATFRVRIIDLGSFRPLTGGVNVSACAVPTTADPTCTPITGAVASYDGQTGYATVTGLPSSQPFRLLVEPGAGASFFPMDFYSQRPPRGTTEEATVLPTISAVSAAVLANAYDPPVVIRSDVTHVLANFLDCSGKPSAGVTFELSHPQSSSDMRIVYMGADGLPDLTRPSTSSIGMGIGVNTPTGSPFTATGSAGDLRFPSFSVRGFPGHLTVVNLYPRAY